MGDEVTWGLESENPYRGGPRTPRDRTPGELLEQEMDSMRRAAASVKRKVRGGRLDHMLTLTYQGVMVDRERAQADLTRFITLVKAEVGEWPRVAVLEQMKSGSYHWHLAVKGFQRLAVLRAAWYQVVGGGLNGEVDVRGPRGQMKGRDLGRYLAKYIGKGLDAAAEQDPQRRPGEHRYRASVGLMRDVAVVRWYLMAGDDFELLEQVLLRLVALGGDRAKVRCRVSLGGSMGGWAWVDG